MVESYVYHLENKESKELLLNLLKPLATEVKVYEMECTFVEKVVLHLQLVMGSLV